MSYADPLPSLLYYQLALDAGDNGAHWVELSEVYMPPHHPSPNPAMPLATIPVSCAGETTGK